MLLLLLLLVDEFGLPGIILNVRSVICILAFSTKEDSSKSDTPGKRKFMGTANGQIRSSAVESYLWLLSWKSNVGSIFQKSVKKKR